MRVDATDAHAQCPHFGGNLLPAAVSAPAVAICLNSLLSELLLSLRLTSALFAFSLLLVSFWLAINLVLTRSLQLRLILPKFPQWWHFGLLSCFRSLFSSHCSLTVCSDHFYLWNLPSRAIASMLYQYKSGRLDSKCTTRSSSDIKSSITGN